MNLVCRETIEMWSFCLSTCSYLHVSDKFHYNFIFSKIITPMLHAVIFSFKGNILEDMNELPPSSPP